MKNCNALPIRQRKLAYIITAMGVVAAMPAFAETEVEALKRTRRTEAIDPETDSQSGLANPGNSKDGNPICY